MPRINKAKETVKVNSRQYEEEFTIDLAVDVLHTALECKGNVTHFVKAPVRLTIFRSFYVATNPDPHGFGSTLFLAAS